MILTASVQLFLCHQLYTGELSPQGSSFSAYVHALTCHNFLYIVNKRMLPFAVFCAFLSLSALGKLAYLQTRHKYSTRDILGVGVAAIYVMFTDTYITSIATGILHVSFCHPS